MNSVLGVIPARLGSTRLPRKPLHRLAGRPLLEWVWRRVADSGIFSELVVATDSEEVARVARSFGARAEITEPSHPSGTDRVAEIASLPAYLRFETVVNVQGDEPFVEREHLSAAVELVTQKAWAIGTIASRIRSLEEWRDPATVKVVCGRDGGALLFSRAPIPFRRDGEPSLDELGGGAFLKHIGIYAYRREALLEWVSLPEGELEQLEKLEQLRALAAGLRIGVAVVAGAAHGVDTPEDAARAELLLGESERRDGYRKMNDRVHAPSPPRGGDATEPATLSR